MRNRAFGRTLCWWQLRQCTGQAVTYEIIAGPITYDRRQLDLVLCFAFPPQMSLGALPQAAACPEF